MNQIFEVKNPDAFEWVPYHAPCADWPYAGLRVDPALRERFGLPEGDLPSRIILKGTSQDYSITENGYLIPYYSRLRDHMDRSRLAERNEELMIDRARSFVNNAQPELGVLRTREQIDHDIALFAQMPERTPAQVDEKAGQFKLITGAVITRLEMLGRMIYQRNTEGAKTEYQHLTGRLRVEERADLEAAGLPIPEQGIRSLTDAEVDKLKTEAVTYYSLLISPQYTPFLRTILLNDHKIDHDGVLIDFVREIGKGLGITNEQREHFVRGGITQKIGWAAESIDKLHLELSRAMRTEPTASLFDRSIQNFIHERGDAYGIHSTEDVLTRLDEYASLCRARACIRGDDSAYTQVFRRKSVLKGLFNGENGLLQSMRRVGRNTGSEVSELRSLLTRGIKLMERTAYTRMPCDEHAPDVWIPNFDSDKPIETYLADQFLTTAERTRSKRVLAAGEMLPSRERSTFYNQEFCSVGRLRADLELLRQHIQEKTRTASGLGK